VQAVRFGSGAMRQTGRHRHRRQQRRRNAADVQGAELGLISCSRAALGARHQPQNQHTVAENAEQVQLNPRGRQRAPLQQPCATGGSCKHGSGRSPALQSSIAQETLP
jgi:ribosomal protein S8E